MSEQDDLQLRMGFKDLLWEGMEEDKDIPTFEKQDFVYETPMKRN